MNSIRITIVAFTVLLGAICCKEQNPPADPPQKPSITTVTISDVAITSATTGGTSLQDGGKPILSKGVVWDVNPIPTVDLSSKTNEGGGTESFQSFLTGLQNDTEYHVRSYATNEVGTSYGNELTFTTGLYDVDGYRYNIIEIGDQLWMAENLRIGRYNNEETIPNVAAGASEWGALSSGAWCNYNNDNQFTNPYGKLYNWYAVTDARKLCPFGWHIPTDSEWTTLSDYLGGEDVAGGKMKTTGTTYWNVPNIDATNESGFNGYPGGYRASDVNFANMGNAGYWWSSTEAGPGNPIIRGAVNNTSRLFPYQVTRSQGYSVRCVKD